MLRKYLAIATLFFAALLLVPYVALAQDGATANVGGFFHVLEPYIVELVSVLIAFFVAWLSAKVTKLTGMQIEAKHREALQMALANGANYGLNKVGGYLDAKDVNLKNQALAAAVAYVQQSVPDALTHFGLTPARVREMVQAKLPTGISAAVVGEMEPFDYKPAPADG
ncbi:hypothetical protein [Rhizobium sp. SSA_523]|uniref:hypothetical protein n=1 Tax=Rhizobium sp. SSA_523 TaxID=2952477 RepID=UPI002090C9FE|nr:hypothetical protein [Rhizobium sp. SSA_523]MCO5730064.1 hypothetical protein [Rhizobium sp. SSA_523]WKC25130.1 hypothetical protein QTJ18_14170 [Rhizobium sp. SSA_523]